MMPWSRREHRRHHRLMLRMLCSRSCASGSPGGETWLPMEFNSLIGIIIIPVTDISDILAR